MQIVIRQCSTEDAETIADILIASKVASLAHLVIEHDRNLAFWIERWRRYMTEGSTAQKSLGDGFVFIAEIDGKAVGFAAYHHTARYDTEAELQSIYVLREAQGKGVGTALLNRIFADLNSEGTRSLCVGYDPDNPYKRFYLKHGAVEINPHWAVWSYISDLT